MKLYWVVKLRYERLAEKNVSEYVFPIPPFFLVTLFLLKNNNKKMKKNASFFPVFLGKELG